MSNLLTKTALAIATVSALSACDSTDKGRDLNYGSDAQVMFENEMITAQFEEESGLMTIDLLAGATAGGESLSTFDGAVYISQMEFEALDGFITPQAESNTITSHTISPFQLSDDGLQLIVDTDLFAESLRACDDTDERGATDADGNAIADGIADFPTSAVYNVTYVIDNGYQYGPGEAAQPRQLQITMTAVDDPVTEVIASAVELPAGGTAQVVASTVPAYACNSAMTYSVADTSIATVDETGLLTGTGVGSTIVTATSVDNPDASATADVTVTAAFSISIANSEVDELGASTGMKTVASCVAAGIKVEPSVINHELNGAYTYDWTSSNSADLPFNKNVANGYGGIGIFNVGANTDVSSSIEVSIASGDTGATSIADIANKSIEVSVVTNEMCDPGVSEHAAGFFVDFNMDGEGLGYAGNAAFTTSTEVVSDSVASVQITAGNAVDADGNPYSWGAQQVWNGQRNWYSYNYGRGLESIGKQYKYAVWVKLNQVPSSTVTLRKVIVPWVYEGVPSDAVGFPGRFDGAGMFTAQLAATTEWQYIEFTDDKTGSDIWSVPNEWNVNTAVFTLWEVYGLPEGDSILLDDYAVIHIEE